jgi:hypothetical protein
MMLPPVPVVLPPGAMVFVMLFAKAPRSNLSDDQTVSS